MDQHTTVSKEWQKSVEIAARSKLVNNVKEGLMKNVFFISWEIMLTQMQSIDQMENKAFKESNSRSEYYFNVAQNTYKLYDSINEELRLNDGIERLNLTEAENNAQSIFNNEQIVGTVNDPKKLNLIQEYLIAILKVNTNNCNLEELNCSHSNCATVTNIMKHLKTCPQIICGTQFCTASKTILNHVEHCLGVDCITCSLVLQWRQMQEQK